MAALDLSQVLDAARPGDGEVHGLAADPGHRLERRLGELDEVAVDDAAVGEAQDRGAGADLPARAVAAHEAVTLEARDQPAGRALGQLGRDREVADAERLLAVEHQGEQLGGPVDRLRAVRDGVAAVHVLELLFHEL